MGEIADELINQEMFGDDWGYCNKPRYKPRGNKKPKGKYRRTAYIHLSPAERKIRSIRKEIAILVNVDGIDIQEARKAMNIKYGKGWRERGLTNNSDDQWSEEDLKEFI